jgi:MFS family permease
VTITRTARRQAVNFWRHVVEGALSSFGGVLVAGQLIFSVLATAMGATPLALGLLISLGRLSFISPLFVAPAVAATRRKKRLVLFLGVGRRLTLLLAAVALLLLARRAPTLCLVVLAALALCRNVAGSLIIPAWLDLMAHTVPRDRLGRVFGFRQSLSAAMGLVAGPACAAIIANIAFPHNYATLYLAGFAAMAASWLIFSTVDEVPADAPVPERSSARRYFRDLLPALRHDKALRYYLLFRIFIRVSAAVRPFYWASHVSRFGVDPGFVAGAYLVSSSVAKILGNALYPFLAERFGYKRILAFGALMRATCATLAAVAPSSGYLVAAYFLDGASMAANQSSGSPFMITLAPAEQRVGYATLLMAILAPVGVVAFPLAGLAMQALGHAPLFAATAVLLLIALAPLARSNPVGDTGAEHELA